MCDYLKIAAVMFFAPRLAFLRPLSLNISEAALGAFVKLFILMLNCFYHRNCLANLNPRITSVAAFE